MKKHQLHQLTRWGDVLVAVEVHISYLLAVLPAGLIFVLSLAILFPADGPM